VTEQERESDLELWGDEVTREWTCPACQKDGSALVSYDVGNGPAYAKLISPCCGRYLKWLPKPTEDNQEKRKSIPRDERFGTTLRYVCEFCLRTEEHLKAVKSRLEVHHVIPVEDGGSDDVSNLRVYCIQCHRQCHARRREMNAYLTKWRPI
jgi:hypothetical protein